MNIDFDPAKNKENKTKHGLDFEDVHELDWDHVLLKIDERFDYGEQRIQAFVRDFEGFPYVVVFTYRNNVMRMISFRRAHERERKKFDD